MLQPHPSPSMSAITTPYDIAKPDDMGVVSSATKTPFPLLRGGGVGEVSMGNTIQERQWRVEGGDGGRVGGGDARMRVAAPHFRKIASIAPAIP